MDRTKIILDTNFLLIPVIFRVDIFHEIERICLFPYELCVVEGTLGELKKIARSASGREKGAARVAEALLKEKGVRVLPMRAETVDEELVERAKEGAIIATQDKDLKRELKFHRLAYIVLRKKSYLLLEGETRCITKKK